MNLFSCCGLPRTAYEEATASSGEASAEKPGSKFQTCPVNLKLSSSDIDDPKPRSPHDTTVASTSVHLNVWDQADQSKTAIGLQGQASSSGGQVELRDANHPQVRQSLEVLMQAGLSRQPHVTWCKSRDLVRDVHELRWVGQGSQGVVYEGVWQGASVAVKWSIADELDTGAYELLFSRLLSHPNVVQTYDAKVAILESDIFQRGLQRVGSTQQPQQPAAGGSAAGAGGSTAGAGAATAATATCAAQLEASTSSSFQRCNSYQSDEGFGDPLGRPSSMSDVRDMLQVIGAKPGQHITQLIMEYCDQGSLLTAISRGIFLPNGRFGSKVALRALYRTAREVAQGMVHLHCAHVIHGDLKPANVLLMNSRKDRRGFVAKVSDFGLAQYCPAAGIVKDAPWGTLVFMAPERFRLNMLSPASDVWSFGVMLWQMYTARLPYEGTRQAQLMLGITTNTLQLEWPEGSPAALVALARACMSYAPAQRPTFSALMQQLAVLESEVRMEGVRLSFSTDVTGTSTPASCATPGGLHSGPSGSCRHGSASSACPPSDAAASALRARVTTHHGPAGTSASTALGSTSRGSSGGHASSSSSHSNSTLQHPGAQAAQAARALGLGSGGPWPGSSCPRSSSTNDDRASACMRHASASAALSSGQAACATAALARAVAGAHHHGPAHGGSRLHSAISQPLTSGPAAPSRPTQPAAANAGAASPAALPGSPRAASHSHHAAAVGAGAGQNVGQCGPRAAGGLGGNLGAACSAAAAASILMGMGNAPGGHPVYPAGCGGPLSAQGMMAARASASVALQQQQAQHMRVQQGGMAVQPGTAVLHGTPMRGHQVTGAAAGTAYANGIKVDTTTRSFEISPAAAAGVGAPAVTPIVITGK